MSRLNARAVYFVMSGASPFLMSTIWIVGAVYYVLAVHMNPLQLVLVGTALEIGYFAFQIPTGLFADLVSRRTSVVIGWCICGACWIVEGLIPTFEVVLAAEAARGIGEAFISGAESAWLAGEVGETQVGPLMIRGSQVAQIAGMAGTVTGVALASIRLNLPILVGGMVLLGIGAFLACAMPENGFRRTHHADHCHWQIIGQTLTASVRAVRASTVLLTLVAVSLVWGASSEGFDRLWEAHLIHDFAFPHLFHFKFVVWFGIIGLANGVVCTIAFATFRRRLQHTTQSQHDTAMTLLTLSAISVVSVVIFGMTGQFIVALGALSIKAVVGSFVRPLYDSWLIQNVDARVRATVLSMTSQADALGQIGMGPVVGAVGTVLSIRAAIVFAGLLLVPSIQLYTRTLNRSTLIAHSPFPARATLP
ncbi:MAG: tetracycline efflux MFS transporter TetA(P) [Chloroflexota bacterium]